MYIDIIQRCANKEIYDIECAYYDINISYSQLNKQLKISINGNYAKLDFVFHRIIDILKNHEINENIFDVEKEKCLNVILNRKYDSPHSKIYDYFILCTNKDAKTYNQILEIIRNIKYNDIIDMQKKLFVSGDTKCLISGNINKEIVNNISNTISNFIKNTDTDNTMKINNPQCKDEEYIFKIENDKEPNNCVSNILHCGSFDYTKESILFEKNRVCVNVINAIVSSVFFDTLRTKECYGYIVNSYSYIIQNFNFSNIYHRFTVQSSVKDNDNIKKRIDEFINEFFHAEILNIKEETIKNICDTKIKILNSPFQTLAKVSNYIFSSTYGDLFFDTDKITIEQYEKIKKEDIIDFYKEYFLDRKSYFIRIEK
jgi:secreted Zn-dependent insulinase-like peptidase